MRFANHIYNIHPKTVFCLKNLFSCTFYQNIFRCLDELHNFPGVEVELPGGEGGVVGEGAVAGPGWFELLHAGAPVHVAPHEAPRAPVPAALPAPAAPRVLLSGLDMLQM